MDQLSLLIDLYFGVKLLLRLLKLLRLLQKLILNLFISYYFSYLNFNRSSWLLLINVHVSGAFVEYFPALVVNDLIALNSFGGIVRQSNFLLQLLSHRFCHCLHDLLLTCDLFINNIDFSILVYPPLGKIFDLR